MKNYEKYKNVELSIEKTTKSSVTFRKNKPNSPIVQMNLSYLSTMNYAIFASLTKVKNKPNQTQYKANSNPIPERPKMNTRNAITMNYKKFPCLPGEKTNPIQTQNKPNFYPLAAEFIPENWQLGLKQGSGNFVNQTGKAADDIWWIELIIDSYYHNC